MHAAVRVRARAHAQLARRRQRGQLRDEHAALVEELLRPVAAHPLLEQLDVSLVAADIRHRHLVRAPRALDRLAVDLLRARPALRRAQDDHRPARPFGRLARARRLLDPGDVVERVVERGGELAVHVRGVVAGDEQRPVAVALEERDELVLGDAREHGRVRDLVAVQVQDGEDGAVGPRVQELVRVPARRQRPGLGLAVADDAADEQVGVVVGGAVRVRERVPELAALVDRAGRLGRGVARDPARERELAEQLAQPVLARADVRVELGVRALEVGVRDDPRPAVARPGDVDRVQLPGADRAVQVHPDQVQAGRRAEVPEQPRLDVLGAQRLAEQRVVEQVDLPDRQVVRRAPVGVDEPELVCVERLCVFHDRYFISARSKNATTRRSYCCGRAERPPVCPASGIFQSSLGARAAA